MKGMKLYVRKSEPFSCHQNAAPNWTCNEVAYAAQKYSQFNTEATINTDWNLLFVRLQERGKKYGRRFTAIGINSVPKSTVHMITNCWVCNYLALSFKLCVQSHVNWAHNIAPIPSKCAHSIENYALCWHLLLLWDNQLGFISYTIVIRCDQPNMLTIVANIHYVLMWWFRFHWTSSFMIISLFLETWSSRLHSCEKCSDIVQNDTCRFR